MTNGEFEYQKDDPWGPDTRWTTIVHASNVEDAAKMNEAWRVLLARYREPVCAALRRHAPGEDVDELFGGFFGYVFERRALARADKNRGKFRCFLQGVIKNYVREQRRARGKAAADIDDVPVAAPAIPSAAEVEEETAWARAFLSQALAELKKKSARDAHILSASFGIGDTPLQTSTELGQLYGLNENAIYQARNRAKKQLTTYLGIVVAGTTDGPDDAFDEIELVTDRLMRAFPGLCD